MRLVRIDYFYTPFIYAFEILNSSFQKKRFYKHPNAQLEMIESLRIVCKWFFFFSNNQLQHIFFHHRWVRSFSIFQFRTFLKHTISFRLKFDMTRKLVHFQTNDQSFKLNASKWNCVKLLIQVVRFVHAILCVWFNCWFFLNFPFNLDIFIVCLCSPITNDHKRDVKQLDK